MSDRQKSRVLRYPLWLIVMALSPPTIIVGAALARPNIATAGVGVMALGIVIATIQTARRFGHI